MRNTTLTFFRQRFLRITAAKQTRRGALLAISALLLILIVVSLPGFRQAMVSAAKKFTAPDAGTMCCGAWAQKSNTGPPLRLEHAMAYAKACNRVVMFGGRAANGANPANATDETWEWDAATQTWTQFTPVIRPAARNGHAMAYDSARNRVVLFAGYNGNFGGLNDTWEYNCSTHTWAQMNPANSPSPRQAHKLAYDPNLGLTVLYGGSNNFQDTWTWNGTNWTQVAGANQPGIRLDHALAFDGFRVMLFGGSKNAGLAANDTWGFTGTAWTQLTVTGPPAGSRHAMAQDPGSQRVILFGGSNVSSGSYSNDTWEWNGANLSWCQATLTAPLPTGREYPAMAYDGRGVIFMGGLSSGLSGLGDTSRYQGSRTYTFRAGLMDNFAPPSDPASPRPALVTQFGNPVKKDFDVTTIDSWVLHSFTGLPANIVSAELEVRMRPGSGDPTNDSINFAFPPNTSVTWGQQMAALPGSGGTWNPLQSPTTFILDLANLPAGAVGQPTNLLSLLNTHHLLDIAIQDDTTVDYIKLRLVVCPARTYFAGLPHESSNSTNIQVTTLQTGAQQLVLTPPSPLEQINTFIGLDQLPGWSTDLLPTADLRAPGTFLESWIKGRVGGIDGQYIGKARISGVDGNSANYSVDFSTTGSATSLVDLFDSTGQLVGTFTMANNGQIQIGCPGGGAPIQVCHWAYFCELNGDKDYALFCNLICATGPDGQQFSNVSAIRVSAINPTVPREFVSEGGLTTMGLSNVTLTGEAVQFHNKWATALGAATLEPFIGENLAVANIGSSGADGVRLNVGKALSADLSFDTLDPMGNLPDGAYVQVAATGVANNQSVSLGNLMTVRKRVPWDKVRADFSALGSTLQRVQVFNGNTQVADVSDFSGDIGASISPTRIGGLLPGFTATFPDATTFMLGNLMVQGDNIRITPLASNVTPTYLTDLTITAADMREFTLTNLALTSYCVAPLDIAPTSLPTGFVPATYPTTQLITTNGTPPYAYSVTGLPPGLQLSASGTLTGTPTQAGTYSVAVTVTDSNGCTGQRTYNGLIVTNCPVINISPASLPDVSLNSSYSQVFTASGGVAPYTFKNAVGSSSPPGLTFSINGALTGMPANLGTFNFTVEVTDANGCKGTKSYTLNVICPPMTASISYATSLADTVDPNVAIGEVISYTLRVNLLEGLSAPITVTDIIPAGLGVLSINGKAAGSAIPLANIPNPVITPTSVACPNASGATITLSYGSINVPVNGNPNDNFFLIQIDAIVCDTPTNSGTAGAQTVFNNSFSVGLTSNTQGQPPVCVVASNQVSATVVEPKLDVKKTFTPNLVQPGATVPITITVTNTGTAPAYALALQDVLGSCLTFLSATAPTGYTVANAAGTVTITGAANTALQVGAANAVTFTINVGVGNCCVVSNTATATAKTLPPNQAGSRTVTGSGSGSLIVNGGNCPCFTVPSSFNMDAWWSFDEMTGTVANDSAGLVNNAGNYGPGTAKPSPTPGVVSKALAFDGVDDYVEVAGSNAEINFPGSCNTPGNKAFTIDSWVKFDAASNAGVITILDKRVSGGAAPIGYAMFLFNGRPGFQIGDGTVFGNFIAPDSIADNNWHFLAVVMDRCNPTPPGQGRIYVDGALVYTFTITNLATPINGTIVNNANLQIGRSLINSSYTRFAIDELEFFKRALTATELNQIYQAGAGGKCKMGACPTPSFAAPIIRKAHIGPVSLAVGDFVPDGKPDLAVGNSLLDVSILSGSSSPPFTPPANYPLSPSSILNKLIAGSFNSLVDTQPDIAVAVGQGTTTDGVRALVSPGYLVSSSNALSGERPRGIATGQFNVGTDNLADLAVANYITNRVVTFKGNGGGFFTLDQSIALPTNSNPIGIVVGRFDGDAFDDFAVASNFTGVVNVYKGSATGAFSPLTTLNPVNASSKPFALAAADVDNDSDLDLIVVNQITNTITVFLNNGSGGFTPSGSFAVGNNPQAVAVGDLNCDGKLDLVVATLSTSISVLLGDGSGGFTASTPLTIGTPQTDVALADLNGDGSLDIAVACPNQGSVYILYNTCPCGGCKLPIITLQPVSQKVCINDTAHFNAVATGPGVSIQWESSADNGATWTPIGGATSNIYDTGETGKLFHAVFATACGTAISDAVSVTIDPTCVKICPDCNPPNTNNLRTGCCSTADSSLTVQAPADVQWEFRSNRDWIIPKGRTGGGNKPTNPATRPSPYGSVSGTGTGTVTFTVTNNPLDTPRTGTISFAGSDYTVTQDGSATPRTMRVVSPGANVSPGTTVNLPIEVAAQGNENSLFFSLSFNPNVLSNPQVTLGSGASGATLDSDSISVPGRFGVSVVLPAGQTLVAGTQQVAVVSFMVAANPGTASTPLVFDDQPTPRLIQDVNLGVLPANFTDATIPVGCNLVISPQTLPNGTVNTAYNQTLTASGGTAPYSFSLNAGALPAGMTLSSTGNLSGTPTATGTFSFTVKVTDANCMGMQAYTLTINPPLLCPTVNNINPTSGVAGASVTITGTNFTGVTAVKFSNNVTAAFNVVNDTTLTTTVPAGAVTGALTISKPGCADVQTGTFTIGCSVITVSPANTTLPAGTVGTDYNQFFNQTGAIGATVWRVSAGSVPTGLTLNAATGVLSGRPTAAGTFTFTIEVTDASNCTGSRAYTLTINPAGNGLQFYPLTTPVRLVDTRPGASANACSQPNAPIAGGTSLTQTARNFCGIPATAQAITGNVTTVASGGGYLTLYPSGATLPTVASTNYGVNEIINNVFTVGLGAADGAFKIFALNTTDVVVDVTGYYAPPATGGLYFHTLPTPVRLLETRAGQTVGCVLPGAPLTGGQDSLQTATTACTGIPAAARAIVGNATTVGPQAGGYLTLFPADGVRPLVASSNYNLNQVVNGPFTVGLSASGQFKIFTLATTELIVDVQGYYSTEATDANGPGLLFTPLGHPVRLVETRATPPNLTGCFKLNAPLNGSQAYTQTARGLCDGVTIPANALGVVGNATVITPLGGGFLTLWPSTAATQPSVATANYNAGQVVNRHFIVGLGSGDGAFKMFSLATTELVIDLSGYFAP